MCTKQEFQMKYEYEDSNFSSTYYPDYKDEEQSDHSQLNETQGELVTVKTLEGNTTNIYLRQGNRLLFCSGKYFYLEHTTAQTEHQKEYTGVVCTCHTCGVKIKGSLKVSSNFICHLKARHPEVYQEFLKQKQDLAGCGTRSKKIERSYSSTHRSSPYPANVPLTMSSATVISQHDKQEKFQRNLLQFLMATNQNFKLVENKQFQELFEFMDFPVQFRATDYYEQIIMEDCKYKRLALANFFSRGPVFTCHTCDVWDYGECKYFALACFWIDDNFQRQSALLACKRLNSFESHSPLANVQNDIFMQYGFQKEYIVNNLTGNIQNYEKDFIDFGLTKEALCMDSYHALEDYTLLRQIQENLKLTDIINETSWKMQQLDLQKLNKIWSTEFIKYMDEDVKLLHRACLEKCCCIWLVCHTNAFKENIKTLLDAPIITPNIFSLTSLYNSLKQLLYYKNNLTFICDAIHKPRFSLTDLEYLEELVDIFEPLHAAFEFLDSPQNHFYGCFLPTLVTLKWKLTRLLNSKKLKHLQDVLVKVKHSLLQEFKNYYELNESKSEAIIAAITYPPVKTRFLMGLQETVSCFNFQARNLLLKYAKDYHQTNNENHMEGNFAQNEHQNVMKSKSEAFDFFDFGDTTEIVTEDSQVPNSLKLEIDAYLADADNTLIALQKYPTIKLDAEELRDINISKKELSELLAELYDGLVAEGFAMDNIDLETPRKFSLNYQEDRLNTPNTTPDRLDGNLNVYRQLDFQKESEISQPTTQETQAESSTVTSSNISPHNDYSFQPNVVSTPCTQHKQQQNAKDAHELCSTNTTENMALIPIAHSHSYNVENSHCNTISVDSSSLNTQLDLIAVPIPGQPNCFKLAKVVQSPDASLDAKENHTNKENIPSSSSLAERYSVPYETNYTCKYVSVRRHVIKEYINKFESLKHAQDNKISSTTSDVAEYEKNITYTGFTQYQYDLMQQQMRIHVQQLTQTYVQTYCHPEFWKLAPKTKEMLLELQEKSKENNNFKIWNLNGALELIKNWQQELDQDTPENTELMTFLYKEICCTNSNSRQIPRFHPRILECYLNSPVFMYPQYLPRMPFSPKARITVFSPTESYLIAMGLEKHLELIYKNKEKIPSKTTPLRTACKRLCKDMLHGKRYRRVWDYIMHLQKVDYYNPIKYFFEHNKAPPVEHEPIIGFANNTVLPPKDRIPELPLVYQTYLKKKNASPKPNSSKKSRKRSSDSKNIKVSEAFKESYIDFVREALGQDLPLPQNFGESTETIEAQISDTDTIINCAEKRKKSPLKNSAVKKRLPQSFTINVNYVFGNSLDVSNTTNSSIAVLPAPSSSKETNNTAVTQSLNDSINTLQPTNESTLITKNNNSLADSTITTSSETLKKNTNNPALITDCPVITYNFDLQTKTLQPVYDLTHNEQTFSQSANQQQINDSTKNINQTDLIYSHQNKAQSCTKTRKFKKVCYAFKLHKKIKQKASAYREKRHLQKRCEDLITAYSIHLNSINLKYKHNPIIQHYYRHFKALEIYTNLLTGLKYICNKYSTNMSSTTNNSPSNLKRSRQANSHTDDDGTPSSGRQVRKLNRQEENFRHMLLPDTPEETQRKDAIYAFNFYEKVEEAFKLSNRPDDCKKFNNILKSFDPKTDKVSDLYYKLENLFLPDHPELAQVFLTFLLPSEAAEIGKFFEHFMINNMATFINKLNIYFHKQPAQIRKIYNCLNDLAEDPNVTMKKIESKIVPLLKGNQFLIDWFMQQFPQNTPPERLFSTTEHIINLKDQQSNRSGEYVETVTDLMDSPTNDNQQKQSCQLRYINGRIFYGSKMLLPAKLSFMAASYRDKHTTSDNSTLVTPALACAHGIREHGEKRLQAAADLIATHTITEQTPSSDDQEKSEGEDTLKALVIDTTADEEDSCSSVELCDEATLHAHALRLNPSVYSSTCYASANATSTPNIGSNYQSHHPHAKKTWLNFNEETKLSPRKNSSATIACQHNLSSPLNTIPNSPMNAKEKRKSPTKKIKSPLNNNKTTRTINSSVQPMVVIHETNSAIQCAKRLKSLIDEGEQPAESLDETIDNKDIIQIVARTKSSLKNNNNTSNSSFLSCHEVKEENTDDLEFLAEDVALSPSPFPCLRMDTDSNEEDVANSTTPTPLPLPSSSTSTIVAVQPSTSALPSDEDSKIEIVTTLTNTPSKKNETTSSDIPLNSAWTREEDKIILIEMKLGSKNRQELYQRIAEKLTNRTMVEITGRHQFLMDFLFKLQGK